ncbi:MAG TPA: general secretion pathway protein GspC [Legionella sp.]|nr:general secretion pathway protein GspC [Legionella sp.]
MTYNAFTLVCQNLSRPIVPRILCCSLMVLMLWQVVTAVSSMLSLNQSTPTGRQLPIKTTISHPAVSSAGLIKPFFGSYIPSNINDAGVKASVLNVEVVGILFSNQKADSQVILKMANGQVQTFRVGDTLSGGALIQRITPEGVLIERMGALESISLPKNELIFEAQPKPLVP